MPEIFGTPQFIMRITMEGRTIEIPYVSERDALVDLQRIFHSRSDSGVWFEGTYWPPHSINSAQILPIKIKEKKDE